MRKVVCLLFTLSGIMFGSSAFAEGGFDKSKAYGGGGLSFNSPDVSGFDSAIGFQFFGGYDFEDIFSLGEGIGFSVEVGYMNSGKFENPDTCRRFNFCSSFERSRDGLWASSVVDYSINSQVKVLGRLGLDIGDDSGIIFGVGGEYQINDRISARGEYVIRPNYKSLQGNVIYRF